MPVLNAFYGNKKVMIVGNDQTAKDIEEALKAENSKFWWWKKHREQTERKIDYD